MSIRKVQVYKVQTEDVVSQFSFTFMKGEELLTWQVLSDLGSNYTYDISLNPRYVKRTLLLLLLPTTTTTTTNSPASLSPRYRVALQFLNASHLDVSLISKRVSLMSAWAAGGVEAGGGMAESELVEDAVSAFVEDTFDENEGGDLVVIQAAETDQLFGGFGDEDSKNESEDELKEF